jgi:cation/acetate symporter
MLFNFLSAILVNKFTSPPPMQVQKIVENIRIPSGAAPANNH